uniref:Cystatin domain-containing protein n=1 Tax=Parascaris univalens TaxID=6257 RepID=A0A915B2Q7_PARUN
MHSDVLATIILSCMFLAEAQVGIPGGFSRKDVDDPKIQALAGKALQRINAASNDLFQQTVLKVISAKTQIVAGTNTVLELLIAPTSCRKNETSTRSCEAIANGTKQICTVAIWEKPWENFEEITIQGCRSA